MSFGSWPGIAPRLDPESLPLGDRERAIARVIAEEVERERRPPGPLLDASGQPVVGLLGGEVQVTDDTPWQVLLTRGTVHARIVERTGLGYVEVLDFALEKCPVGEHSVWALFWYRQWIETAFESHTREEVEGLIAAVREESSALARAGGQASGAVRREKKAELVREALLLREEFRSKRHPESDIANKVAKRLSIGESTVRKYFAASDSRS